MADCKVSVLITVYNAEKYIENTLHSVINQTLDNIEILIIDDASTDNSVDLIKNIDDKRIHLFQNEANIGKGKSLNRLMESIQGEYIAFIDSDDIWKNDKLEKQIAFMVEHSSVFSHTAYKQLDENGSYLKTISAKERVSYKEMLRFSRIGYSTVVIKKSAFYPFTVAPIRKRQDYALWLGLLQKQDAIGLNIPLTDYLVRSNSLSSNKASMIKWNYRVYREILKMNTLCSLYYLLWDVMSKVLKLK